MYVLRYLFMLLRMCMEYDIRYQSRIYLTGDNSFEVSQTSRQIGVAKTLSSSVNEYKDYQPMPYNIHTV